MHTRSLLTDGQILPRNPLYPLTEGNALCFTINLPAEQSNSVVDRLIQISAGFYKRFLTYSTKEHIDVFKYFINILLAVNVTHIAFFLIKIKKGLCLFKVHI